MKEKHLKHQTRIIRSGISEEGKKLIRVKPSFDASDKQIDLIKRINKARKIISSLDDNTSIVICGKDKDILYLFRLTEIYKKNIMAIVDDVPLDMKFMDHYHHGTYPVCSNDDERVLNAEAAIICSFWEREERKRAIELAGFTGQIIELYDENDKIPFFCVEQRNAIDDWNIGNQNEINRSLVNNKFSVVPASDYYLSMLPQVDKINEVLSICGNRKVIVYGVGIHTDILFMCTDIRYMNVIGFADRSRRQYAGMKVRGVSYDELSEADYIVISTCRYQNEIADYLDSIGLGNKKVLLYDKDDRAEFYENKNNYSPDLVSPFCGDLGYTLNEVYAAAEMNCNSISKSTKYYLNYMLFHDDFSDFSFFYKGEDEVQEIKKYSKANRKTALVLQGPPVYEKDFTYKTLLLYKMLFPESIVILSTWQSEALKEEFSKFNNLDIEIVLSYPPKVPGVLNVNYQLKSTYEGIIRAKERGAEYVLKTRTDIRQYGDNAISFLYNLTEKLGCQNSTRKRISILPPFLDQAYYIPDYICFGRVDDMLDFWDARKEFPNNTSGINPEMLIFSRYFRLLDRYIEDPVNNLEDYIKVICDFFIVVDPALFRYVWRKYSYESTIPMGNKNSFTFVDWFNRVLSNVDFSIDK